MAPGLPFLEEPFKEDLPKARPSMFFLAASGETEPLQDLCILQVRLLEVHFKVSNSAMHLLLTVELCNGAALFASCAWHSGVSSCQRACRPYHYSRSAPRVAQQSVSVFASHVDSDRPWEGLTVL